MGRKLKEPYGSFLIDFLRVVKANYIKLIYKNFYVIIFI